MLYTATNLRPVSRLHYAWTGWPTEGTTLPPLSNLDALATAWQTDGFRLLAHDANASRVMLTFESDANVSPSVLAQRVKGRLNNTLRLAGTPASFSRKVSVRTLGENISDIVEDYLRDQLKHIDLVDDRYRQLLAEAALEDPTVSLADPAETDSGRYWNNLHVVLVTADRYRVGRPDVVHGIRDRALAAAREIGLAIRAIAVMPDHLHVALRSSPALSPLEVGIALQNATAKAMGCRLWQYGFYVGTFSEYGLDVVRQRARLL
ncbi:MAG: transposase [bacterium]